MEILRLINNERKSAKVPELTLSNRLFAIADRRSIDMASLNVPLSHLDNVGLPAYRIDQDIYESRGEVIFANFTEGGGNISLNDATKGASRVVLAFMQSNKHKEVLLHGIFRYLGISQSTFGQKTVITGILSNLA